MIRPTPSFSLAVPRDATQEVDQRVSSFWVPGESVLLQISSYARKHGFQVSATERLQERLAKEKLIEARDFVVSLEECPNCAAIQGRDDKNVYWVHVYAVWPDLTIYATLSWKNPDNICSNGKWAVDALRSIRRSNNFRKGERTNLSMK